MSIPEQQKALVLPAKYAELVVQTVPVPKPGPGQLLVKIHSVALNPVDWKIQRNGIIVHEFPGILGTDIAGTVAGLGDGVDTYIVGDRVFGQGIYAVEHAGFQQYTVLNADVVAKIPENVSFDQASTLPVGLDTAALGLFTPDVPPEQDFASAGLVGPWEDDGLGKYNGKPIMVFGAASSVGQYAVQLAKLAGFSPIIATASLHNTNFLLSLGATHVLDRSLSSQQLGEEVRKITTQPLDVIFDAISAPDTQLAAYELLAPGGTLVLVLFPAIPQERLRPNKRLAKAFGQANYPEVNRKVSTRLYKKLSAWLRDGHIKPNRVEVLPNGLEGIVHGLERLRKNQVSGVKLVAHVQEAN